MTWPLLAVLHGLLATLGAKTADSRVHIDVSAKLSDINLEGLEFGVMPDGAAVDDFATKVAASKKKGIARPFPFVDLHDFLPHWARSEGAMVFNEEGDQVITKRSKMSNLTWPQWQAAYGRFAIASAVVGVWSYRSALAHREVVLQVCSSRRCLCSPFLVVIFRFACRLRPVLASEERIWGLFMIAWREQSSGSGLTTALTLTSVALQSRSTLPSYSRPKMSSTTQGSSIPVTRVSCLCA